MGLLGSNFTKAMLAKGIQVQVWNRTAAKARELEQFGAKAFADAADAVRGADTIHVTLKDDASVDEVLADASAGLTAGATIIDHTTTSVNGVVKRTNQWKERGIVYQHAPVFMAPSNALEATGFMLISGDKDIVDRLSPELSAMTGKLLNFGTETGKAAAVKLLGNMFLVAFTAGIADMLSLAKALNTPLEDMLMLFNAWNPGTTLPGRITRVASGDYSTPAWELNMARKDTQLFMDAAKEGGTELHAIPAIAALMDSWIAKGHGQDDWTVIGKLT